MTGRRRPAVVPAAVTRCARVSLLLALGAALIWSGPPLPEARAADPQLLVERVLRDPAPNSSSGFAQQAALHGDDLAVYSERDASGRVDLYRRSGNTWAVQRSIATSSFVRDVAISSDTVAIAEGTVSGGEVRLYDLGSTAAPVVIPAPSGPPFPEMFAVGLAIDDDRLVVGHRQAVYVYDRSGSTWPTTPTDSLTVDENQPAKIDVSGNLIVATDFGYRSHAFRRTNGSWSSAEVVQAPDFGTLVDASPALVHGSTILITSNGSAGGSVSVFTRQGGEWKVTQSLPVPAGAVATASTGAVLAVVDQRGKVQSYTEKNGRWVTGPSTSIAQSRPESFAASDLTMAASNSRLVVAQPSYAGATGTGAGRLVVLRSGSGPSTLPNAPTALTVTPSTSTGTAKVTWKAAAGPKAKRYRVRAVSQIPPESTGMKEDERYLSATTTTTTFTGLTPLGPYKFTVQAINDSGESSATSSLVVRLGGPAAVGSPHTRSDPSGDQSDPRLDIRSVTGEANGETFTVTLRNAAAPDPYTDTFFRRPGGMAYFNVDFLTPGQRYAVFQHRTNNDTMFIEGEDFTFRFKIRRPCKGAIVPARFVDGAYQASIPARCFDYARAARLRASTGTSDSPTGDQTDWTPPIRRVTTRGNVTIDPAKVSSTTLWAKTNGKIKISVTARHWTGIKKAILVPFSLDTGTRPVRVGKTTCQAKSKTTSTCSATVTVRPGEVRDLDSGLWRVFAQVESKNGAAAVEENAATFSVRRGNELTGKTTVSGEKVSVTGHLRGARWSSRSYADLKGRPVLLQLKARGTSSYQTIREVKTDDNGDLAATVSTRLKGTWRLKFEATKTYAGRTVTVGRTG